MWETASENLEIIRLVEQSHLPVRRALAKLGIQPARFERWYDRLQTGGRELSEAVDALVVWGMRWARDEKGPRDPGVSLLMADELRRIDKAAAIRTKIEKETSNVCRLTPPGATKRSGPS